MCTKRCAHEHTGQRRTSDIPCAMALRLITYSPRRTALLPPLRPESCCLQVHRRQHRDVRTTRLCRTRQRRSLSAPCVHRISPHGRGDHDPPLWSGETDQLKHCFVIRIKRNIFYLGLDMISVNRKCFGRQVAGDMPLPRSVTADPRPNQGGSNEKMLTSSSRDLHLTDMCGHQLAYRAELSLNHCFAKASW